MKPKNANTTRILYVSPADNSYDSWEEQVEELYKAGKIPEPTREAWEAYVDKDGNRACEHCTNIKDCSFCAFCNNCRGIDNAEGESWEGEPTPFDCPECQFLYAANQGYDRWFDEEEGFHDYHGTFESMLPEELEYEIDINGAAEKLGESLVRFVLSDREILKKYIDYCIRQAAERRLQS